MQTLTRDAACEEAIEAAAACLAHGGLVAMATETVYGLGADATNGEAVARIFEAKGRPRFNPLICHVSDFSMARSIAEFGPPQLRLVERFWPGPLTIVCPAKPDSPVHELVTAGLSTVAIRMPVGSLRDVVARLGRPVAAPSANRSGRVSPTTAAHVERSLGGRIDMILDGGPTSMGLESTIVRPQDGQLLLLRSGAVAAAELEAAGWPVVRPAADGPIEAPGQLRSHYAPAGRVRLDARRVEPGEYLISFGPGRIEGESEAAAVLNLSRSGDLREAASRLFAVLAEFDRPEIERIAVAPIPPTGLGEAINDRLQRAAAPR